MVKNPKFWLILVIDVLLVVLAHLLAYEIKFEYILDSTIRRQFATMLPLLLGIKISSFYLFGLYRGMWRYTSFNDIRNILTASLFSSSVLVSVLLLANRLIGYSRTVFLLDLLFTFALITFHRASIRYFYQRINLGSSSFMHPTGLFANKKRLLLIGSGDEAEKVLRELDDNKQLPYYAIGLVDEDPQKVGMKLHGVPVIGLVDDIQEHVRRSAAQEILIATLGSDKQQMNRFVSLCQQTQLPYKVLPSMGELINGQVSIKSIRDISYKDLLGREEVRLDLEKIEHYLTGKTVLITGAGGSIGSELCRQVCRFSPCKIVLLDCSEENLYNIQMQLTHEHPHIHPISLLGKVQDVRLLNQIFATHQPDVVFHTAAYKHVPLVEHNPWQAVHNNIIGSQLLMEASLLHGVKRFVLVSTDKAVRPTSVMGASKRVTELLMLAYSQSTASISFSPAWSQIAPLPVRQTQQQTHFMGVRFGNVLGSSGSVIPLFKRQIEQGGPVTVTHPDVTRYFMSAEEAAQLILQSCAMGKGGEIFILKMGVPVKIAQMARDLIRLTGREPDTDVFIEYIGLRAGEKLFEELLTVGVGIVDTQHEKIMVLHGETPPPPEELRLSLMLLTRQAKEMDSHGIKQTLQALVPEYQPDFRV